MSLRQAADPAMLHSFQKSIRASKLERERDNQSKKRLRKIRRLARIASTLIE